MAETNIKLTNDSLTNIKLMIPLLNDRARERIADVIYGCCISEVYSKSELKTGMEQPCKSPISSIGQFQKGERRKDNGT